jgi:predicted Zn-dependent protease with MMP-like domain
MMNQNKRDDFDRQVERVLARLPQHVLRLLNEVPLHVEDKPPKRLMQELRMEDGEELCGFFSGVPFGERNVFDSAVPLPSSITIFRRGIIAEARAEFGKVSVSELRRQIRITILHELAHLHGMDENEITEIGYG